MYDVLLLSKFKRTLCQLVLNGIQRIRNAFFVFFIEKGAWKVHPLRQGNELDSLLQHHCTNRKSDNDGKEENEGVCVLRIGTVKYPVEHLM